MDKTVEIIIYVTIALVGLCIGSFLNVLIYRLPLGMNIASPPSHCPNCDQKIKWYDNIPLLSYIILGGKCRHCKTRISPRYFIVELINILLWVIILIVFGLSVYSAILLLLSSILLAIICIDFEHQIIPDSLNIAIGILGVVATVYSIFDPIVPCILGNFTIVWWERLAGGLGGGLFFTAIFYFYLWIRKKEGLGGGDVKLIAALGLILGYKLTILCIGFSAIFACLYLLVMKIAKKLEADKPFAFGPFLATAAFTSIIVGNYLINLYLSLF